MNDHKSDNKMSKYNNILKNVMERLKKSSPEKNSSNSIANTHLNVFSEVDFRKKEYITLKIKCFPNELKFQSGTEPSERSNERNEINNGKLVNIKDIYNLCTKSIYKGTIIGLKDIKTNEEFEIETDQLQENGEYEIILKMVDWDTNKIIINFLNPKKLLIKTLSPMLVDKLIRNIVYYSDRIEGSTISKKDSKILNSKRSPVKKNESEQEFVDHFETFKKLVLPMQNKNVQDIDLNFIYKLHKSLKISKLEKNRKSGVFRTVDATHSSKADREYFVSPEHIEESIKNLLHDLHNTTHLDINKAVSFHHKFLNIHCFEDGNGRVARLLLNCLLMQIDYLPCIIQNNIENIYYASLNAADKNLCNDDNNKYSLLKRIVVEGIVKSYEIVNKN